MGSFYSTCSVSHMTLSHQKTSIQLLVPTWRNSLQMGNGEKQSMIVSNSGCMAFFTPFGFPIRGEYDDYGYITNITRDANVEMLEDFFNCDIEDILENLGDDRYVPQGRKGGKLENEGIFKQLFMTYFRTEVLEHLESGWESLLEPTTDKYSSNATIANILEYFTVTEEDLNLSKRDASFFKRAVAKFTESRMTIEEIAGAKARLLEVLIAEKSPSSYECRTYITSICEIDMFDLLPISTEKFKEDICRQFKMLMLLSGMNRHLMVSDYGSQDTNWDEIVALNTFVNGILESDRIERKTWDIEDYMNGNGTFDRAEYEKDFGEMDKIAVDALYLVTVRNKK